VERLLFFTPVLPGVTGQGTAIRAGMALELLSEKYEVTVVHVDLWTGDPAIADRGWPLTKAVAYHFLPSPVLPDAPEKLVQQHLASTRFDALYVFRLVAAPMALRVVGLLAQRPIPSVLDLDDDEYARTEKFLALRDNGNDVARVGRERAELQRLRGFARLMMLRFDLCLLAANEDLEALAAQYPDRRFSLLPNVMRTPDEPPPLRTTSRGTMLFLGTLDYMPNEDGALYFVNSVLPLLLHSGRQVEFRIVGIKAPQSIQGLRDRPGVKVVGAVKDVAPEYARARMMVVPLRAGSGTRIKILEAFRFGVPVVSTSIGAAGLDVQHGVHLLIANTPEEFSAACQRLMEDDALSAALAKNAFAWLRETHSLERARPILHGLFARQESEALTSSLSV
jgi:glycosyltransferase involved in cell wall biosynthesis